MEENLTNNIKFRAESLVIKCDRSFFEEMKENIAHTTEMLDFTIPDYDAEKGEMTLYNSDHVLIDEALYISKQRYFSEAMKRLHKKISAENLLQYVPSTNEFKIVHELDKDFASAVLAQIRKNNINSDRGNISFEIPADFFDLLLPISDEDPKILNYLKELFSLILLSDSVDFQDNIFIFRVKTSNTETSEKEVTWQEWDSLADSNYYKAYTWIKTKHKENYGMSTLIKVIRQVMAKTENLKLDSESEGSFDSILNIIISEQTEVYFEQQNKLKEEFLSLNKDEIDSSNKLFSKLLGLIVSIGVAIYGVLIKNIQTDDEINILKPNSIIGISFCIAMLALLFFCFTFFVDVNQRKKMYIKLKNFYVSQLHYSQVDFENSVEEPRYFVGHVLQLLTLLFFFIFSTVGFLFYFKFFKL